MRIARATDAAALSAASSLMPGPILPAAGKRFLENPSQHLLVVYDEEDRIAGCVFGFEVTHLDEGTEMFLHDLTVARGARRLGVATG
ncbi:MAG: GNAT family N-acetyltransferase, partial [Candidatus Dormiibacterota bacterium]